MLGKEKKKSITLNFSCQIPMKHMNTKQECKFKNNLKEQAEMIKLLIFSIGVYLNILT